MLSGWEGNGGPDEK